MIGMRYWLAGAASLALAGCGEGGSGGGTPTPIPTSTSSPTPTPTPTPAPTASARVVGISPAFGRLDFYNTLGSNTGVGGEAIIQGFTSRDGLYFPGYLNAIYGYVGLAAGANPSSDYSNRYKIASGIDAESGMGITLFGPPEAKIISPLTSLLAFGTPDQARLKTQLGIRGSLFGMVADPNVLIYDPLAELASSDSARSADGARMLSAHVRILAIIFGGYAGVMNRLTPFANDQFQGGFNNVGWDTLALCLQNQPNQFIFSNAIMAEIVKCQKDTLVPAVRPETFSAVAHLIDAYIAAAPVRLEGADMQARWILGIRGYLFPAITVLAGDQSDAAIQAALAVGSSTILNETSRYAEHYAAPATGLFFPQPDFVIVRTGTTISVNVTFILANDLSFGASGNGGILSDGTVQSVTVPATNTAQLTAQLSAETISITPTAGFKGATYFDYVTKSGNGNTLTQRVFVRVI